MTRDPTALYQGTILEHAHRPKNVGPLLGATHEATLDNPLCGDRVTIQLKIEDDRVVDAKFSARGCLIAQAAASLFTEAAIGRSAVEVTALAHAVEAIGESGEPAALGPLEVLTAAREFPARLACVSLAAKTARRALGAKR
jgi:nitrogen fixation NifU-like protein